MDMKQILSLVDQPAFLAKDGEICWCNAAARQLVRETTPLCGLLEDNGVLFSLWDRQGALQLPLLLGGKEYDASVCATDEGDLFIAGRQIVRWTDVADVMLSFSANLRRMLQPMLDMARTLFDAQESSPEAAGLNRALYRLVRLCNQYSDGGQLLGRCRSAHRRPVELNAFFDGFAADVVPLTERTGRRFHYVPLKGSVRGDIDAELMERALYNLLANALQYTPAGGEICLMVERQDRLLLVQLSDTGEGIQPELQSSLFERFGVAGGDGRRGAGLGLSIAREVIRLHNGTMTVTSGQTGTTVRAALPLLPAPLALRSPVMQFDNCGGLNHALVELSDALPSALYDPEEVL